VAHNHALENGGGVASGWVLTMTESVVAENSADGYAGGLFVGGFESNLIEASQIVSNTAPNGAGVYVEADELVVQSTTLAGNEASGAGGGLFVNDQAALRNVTISGNRAGDNGGGIAAMGYSELEPAQVDLNNVTLADNRAGTVGPGLGGGAYISPTANVRVTNTIVAGNIDHAGLAPDCAGTLASGGHNLLESAVGCSLEGGAAGDLTGVPALLGVLDDNGGPTPTHTLLPGSPALNAGSAAAPGSGGDACEADDQRGIARPQAGWCDIGAYEAEPPALPGAGFSAAGQTALEAAGAVTVAVMLTARSNVTVTVPYTVGGTAVGGGVDHGLADGAVNVAPGTLTATLSFGLTPDALVEADETIVILLGVPLDAFLTGAITHVVTILDDDYVVYLPLVWREMPVTLR
jgi:hypothetical protein